MFPVVGGEFVLGEVLLGAEIQACIGLVGGEVGVGFDGALLDALEGLHEAVGGLVAVA